MQTSRKAERKHCNCLYFYYWYKWWWGCLFFQILWRLPKVHHFQTELISYLPLTAKLGLILWSNFYYNLLFVFIKTFYLGYIWYFTVFEYFNMLLLNTLLGLSILHNPNCVWGLRFQSAAFLCWCFFMSCIDFDLNWYCTRVLESFTLAYTLL